MESKNLSAFARSISRLAAAALALLLGLGALVSKAPAAAQSAGKAPSVLFLISEDPDNYEAHKTIPPFAESLQKTHGYRTTVLKGEGPLNAFRFAGLAEALAKADVVVFYSRRIALSHEQLNAFKGYLKAGNPLVAIRTANHGMTVRGKVEDGYAHWPEFVADILGCENRGYGSIKDGIKVSLAPGAAGHPILKGVPEKWFSNSNVYHVGPLLDPKATILVNGQVPKGIEPLAWTRMAGKSRVFYTSLGHPNDFKDSQYLTLLANGITWALGAKAK